MPWLVHHCKILVREDKKAEFVAYILDGSAVKSDEEDAIEASAAHYIAMLGR